MTASGARRRKYFPTLVKAQKFSASVRASHAAGVRGSMISASLALQAAEAERVLAGSGVTIVEAARMAVAKLGGNESRETFGERYARALLANENTWSAIYSNQMAALTRWVPASFMDRVCGGIDRAVIESACREMQPTLKQSSLDMKASRILAIIGFRPRHRKSTDISILSVAQCAKLLRVCERVEERRVVALLLFSGIRPDSENGEIGRLEWSAVKDDYIDISPAVSKTSSDRHIPITPRLRRLIKGHPKDGPVCPSGWRRAWQRIRRDAGIAELSDVCRHTFASNFLEWKGSDSCKAAMGHTAGSTVLFRHYARAIKKDAGEKFFR